MVHIYSCNATHYTVEALKKDPKNGQAIMESFKRKYEKMYISTTIEICKKILKESLDGSLKHQLM